MINIEQPVSTEEIFLETYNKLSKTPHSDDGEKTRLLEIFSEEGVKVFVYGLLLDRLEYLLNTLNTWGFRTQDGKEFPEYMRANLEAFKKNSGQVSFGDVLGLTVMMEKLTALHELLRTEKIFEHALEALR